jgi:hypothetical protein
MLIQLLQICLFDTPLTIMGGDEILTQINLSFDIATGRV